MGLGLDHTDKFAASIEEEEIALRSGDLIILFTDGVTEARNEDGEEFQYERLARVAEMHAGEAPQDLIRAIIRSVQEFTRESEALDDMTLLALKWNGPDAGGNAAQEILLYQEERHHE
jgi:serine phosphatase RsbU (regulator of sigma subunit)